MRVLIFGASGIVGQHLRLCVPQRVESLWFRKHADLMHLGCDLENWWETAAVLSDQMPDVIINLAGQNDVDVVECDPAAAFEINMRAPQNFADWCDEHDAHYVHISSQAVFAGTRAPYSENALLSPAPINEYGEQKRTVELYLKRRQNWTIARLTFMVGVRPLPVHGRRNPIEAFLSGEQPLQVNDRMFSVAFARDTARELWNLVQERPKGKIVNIGIPGAQSRYSLMLAVNSCLPEGEKRDIVAVQHWSFPGIAPRPFDTTYAEGLHSTTFSEGTIKVVEEWHDQERGGLTQRAREVAIFLGVTEQAAFERLSQGFHYNHAKVAEDFRAATPRSDKELLDWYQMTEAYVWELSAYHEDERFNYSGMVNGIAARLATDGKRRVLCLGDGIGDLTMACQRAGIDPIYHDLADSRTAGFAKFRFWAHLKRQPNYCLTVDWRPLLGGPYDAVIALDFMEHLTNVEEWTRAIYSVLTPGGLFAAQNAFNCGSGEQGSIPMHLSDNDHYEQDWGPLLERIGLRNTGDIWWRKT